MEYRKIDSGRGRYIKVKEVRDMSSDDGMIQELTYPTFTPSVSSEDPLDHLLSVITNFLVDYYRNYESFIFKTIEYYPSLANCTNSIIMNVTLSDMYSPFYNDDVHLFYLHFNSEKELINELKAFVMELELNQELTADKSFDSVLNSFNLMRKQFKSHMMKNHAIVTPVEMIPQPKFNTMMERRTFIDPQVAISHKITIT